MCSVHMRIRLGDLEQIRNLETFSGRNLNYVSTLSMAMVVVVSSERPTVRSLRFIRSNQRATEQSNGSYSRRTPLLA